MDRLVFWIYRSMGRAVQPLSVAMAYRLGAALGLVGYYLGWPYRRLALRNLEIAFGDSKSPRERCALARKHFTSLVGNLLAGLRIARMPAEEVRKLAVIEGWEHVEKLLANKPPLVGLISHIGNWELLAQLLPLLLPGAVGTVYQRLGNRYIDAEIRASRARKGMQLFERKDGLQAALQIIRTGFGVGVLVDQHAGDGGIWCSLFGRLASTSPLAATLAVRTQAKILPVAVHTIAPGRWRMVIDAPFGAVDDDIVKLTQDVNRALEVQILRNPSDWLWVHNRWKTPKPKFLLATYKRGVAVIPGETLKPFRILIRASNWLGDAVMSMPAVRAIKEGRPDAHVTILTPAKLADAWKAMPEVDDIISIPRGRGILGTARSIRGKFDAAVVFPNSLRTGLEVWLAGIPRRVGYPGHSRHRLLDQVFREKRKRPRPPEHQANHYLRLAEFIGAEPVSEIRLAPAQSKSARVAGPARLGLCPGAEYGPAKRWLPERFAEVMTTVAAGRECEWVLFGVAGDAEIGREIVEKFPGQARNLIGQTTLAQLIEELRQCDLLVTNDTGTMHLAALLGVPTAAIFGSTEPVLTGPLGTGHRILRKHVACSPCFLRRCPIDFRCMKRVETAEVVAAVEAILRDAGFPSVTG